MCGTDGFISRNARFFLLVQWMNAYYNDGKNDENEVTL